MFHRMHTDGTKHDSGLDDAYAGPTPTPCWLVGAGPSLTREAAAAIRASGAPVMAVNFAGRAQDGEPPFLKPDFWTTWDPTPRFHGSIFRDPTIAKFCQERFRMDLVPGTTFKVCESPNVHFFDRQVRGYADFLDRGSDAILDCKDSMIQAIDVLFRLGFRVIFTAGTELRISPSAEQAALAVANGVEYRDGQTLVPHKKDGGEPHWSDRMQDFLRQCLDVPATPDRPSQPRLGKSQSEVAERMEAVDRERQYAFSERKRFLSAVSTDEHYFTTVQYLRLARRNISLNGLRIVNCSPGGRLAPYFESLSIDEAAAWCRQQIGDPATEETAGRYEGRDLTDKSLPVMTDFAPYSFGQKKAAKKPCGGCQEAKAAKAAAKDQGVAEGPPEHPDAGEPVDAERERIRQRIADAKAAKAEVVEDA